MAAGAAVGAALYGGTIEDVLQAAIKGATIGAISGAAFYGVGSTFAPTEKTSTASQIESMAAHGAVGGAKSAAEGGDFWKGFIATAATKASSLWSSLRRIFRKRCKGLSRWRYGRLTVRGQVCEWRDHGSFFIRFQ
jgi:hypothetical protein